MFDWKLFKRFILNIPAIYKKRDYFLICLCLLAGCAHSAGDTLTAPMKNEPVRQDIPAKWIRVGGYWKVGNSRAFEERGRAVRWLYHELMNYNTLLASEISGDFTEFSVKFQLCNLKVLPVEEILGFALQSPYKYYYYNFFGVKFTGDAKSIKNVSIVRSQRKDPNAGYSVKNNFTVDTLFTMDYQMQYNHDYVVKIEKKDDTKPGRFGQLRLCGHKKGRYHNPSRRLRPGQHQGLQGGSPQGGEIKKGVSFPDTPLYFPPYWYGRAAATL
jgi:hypothetical protein